MPNDDLLVLFGVLLVARALKEWNEGVEPKLKDAGARLYDDVHQDWGHQKDLPGKQMRKAELVELATRAGFPDPNVAAAIALAESGGVPNALGDGGVSVGLWQINTRAHPKYSRDHLAIPFNNALAAFEISDGGTNWKPWSVFTSGRYLRFL